MRWRFPILTLAMLAPAVGPWLSPNISTLFIYDRAAILSGELWRLFTGNWVHFSVAHFTYDALALSLAGWLMESRGHPYYGWLCALSPLAIGVALLALNPALRIYGGLSGVATAAIVLLALQGLEESGRWRLICLIVLSVTIAKILVESMTNQFIFVRAGQSSFALVPASHITGALMALFIHWRGQLRKLRPPGPAPQSGTPSSNEPPPHPDAANCR